ncbi:MAG: S41 family peptidase [Bacteroidales bacterium]|nr:S41 family peptidase [Bacteroidales bacterium]
MKKILLSIISGCLLLAVTSCEKALMVDDVSASPTSTFGYLWKKFDQQYAMFDVKKVDWNAMYDSLYPRINDTMSSDSLFLVCAALLNSLHDGHVNLYTPYDVGRSDSIYYDFYSQSDIDVNTVVLHYMGVNYHVAGGLAHAGLCGDSVIYIRYGSFSNAIGEGQLRHLLHSYPNAKGMIFDIRGNGGGNVANIYRFLKLMPSHGQPLYYSQIKSGPAHDDFSPLETTYAPLVSASDTDVFEKPVIVLIDRGCFSAASSFAICTYAYPNITLMGDTTSGGLGMPSTGVLPNGWRYRITLTRTLALDGGNYENGVPPDIPLRLDWEKVWQQGRDNIIDSACAILMK